MVGSLRQHPLIGLDSHIDAALFDEPPCLFHLLCNIYAHAGSKGFPTKIATAVWRTAGWWSALRGQAQVWGTTTRQGFTGGGPQNG